MFSYTFYPKPFSIQFHRSVLLHILTATHFLNWTNTLLSSWPILELYPSNFLHKQIFGTVLLHLSLYFLISSFFCQFFLEMYSYPFYGSDYLSRHSWPSPPIFLPITIFWGCFDPPFLVSLSVLCTRKILLPKSLFLDKKLI
jgi:hypothetical protein